MKLKKILAALLAISMVAGMTACGGDAASSAAASSAAAPAESAAATEAAPAAPEAPASAAEAAASTQEHREIVNAIARHDPDEAERLMGVHVQNARNSFFDLID